VKVTIPANICTSSQHKCSKKRGGIIARCRGEGRRGSLEECLHGEEGLVKRGGAGKCSGEVRGLEQ
jgi:hypothetical protein